MRVLDSEEMRRFDAWAIEHVGLPSEVLMENAAVAIADALGQCFEAAVDIGILCGPGNNGGDGLALLRQLEARGYRATAWLAAAEEGSSQDLLRQLAICRRLGLPAKVAESTADPAAVVAGHGLVDVWVDALFGTGLSRPLSGSYSRWVDWLNAQSSPVLSIDLPSGLDASKAVAVGPHVVAEVTVALGALKIPLVLAPAADFCGRVIVGDLGVRYRDIDPHRETTHLLVEEEVSSWLRPRSRTSHKGDYGRVLVIAGSSGMAGAAVLAARGALRSGAGLVTLAVPPEIRVACAAGSLESMLLPLRESVGPPGLASGRLVAADLGELLEAAEARDAVVLGPGLGRESATVDLVRRLVAETKTPMVIDADALFAFAEEPDLLAQAAGPRVLTPHAGELARLLGVDSASIEADRPAAVRELAERSSCASVLKGHRTLVVGPEGDLWINSTGNPGMASGGTGDVLSGVIGCLLGQDYEATAAAQIGVYLHGLAGDHAAQRLGESGLLANDLAECLPAARRSVEAPRHGPQPKRPAGFGGRP